MGKGIRIGTIVGAPVVVSAWWFVIAAFLTVWVAPVYRSWLPDLGRNGEYLLAAGFVVLLYLSAFLHELGHAFSARAFGLRVHGIELTALGGLTRMDSPGTPGRAAVTSAAGPAVNVVLLGVAYLAFTATHVGTLPHLLAAQLAWTNALLAVFNLLPGLPLDGGAILRAFVWRVTGRTGTATAVAAWGGRVVAGLAVLYFLRNLTSGSGGASFGSLWTLFLAFWIWNASSAALAQERTRSVVPTLSARQLARPVVSVAPDTPVAVMMEQIAAAGARGALVVDPAGRATGVVNEAAVSATPRERWPWVSSSDVSRRVTPALTLDADLAGERLLLALAAEPATEYVVQDAEGGPVGVLAFADVNAALNRR